MRGIGAAEFEAVIREQLAGRDRRRRLRLHDPVAQAEADQRCVTAIMGAAGYPVTEDGEQLLREARRAQARNEEAAFGPEPERAW